jgi:hypothetical protein
MDGLFVCYNIDKGHLSRWTSFCQLNILRWDGDEIGFEADL